MINRTEAMLLHFFDALCGPKCTDLKVENGEKYNFVPKQLLGKITLITSNFLVEKVFLEAMVQDADYSPEIMEKAVNILKRHGIVPQDIQEQMEMSINKMNSLFAERNSKREIPMEISEQDQDGASEMEFETIDESEIESVYKETLGESLFDTVEMKNLDNSFNHHYAKNISESSLSGSNQKMVKLRKVEIIPNSFL